MTNFFTFLDGKRSGVAHDLTPRLTRPDSVSFASRLRVLPILLLCLTLFLGVGQMWGDESWNLATNSHSSASTSLVTWSGTNASMTLEKNGGTNANNYLGGVSSHNHTRVYNSNILRITPASGQTISSIEITATSSSYTITGTWTNGSASTSGSKTTVTPTDGTKAVYCTCNDTKRLTGVVVKFGSACSKKVTISKGTPSHGDFELSKTGAQATCDAAVTVVVTPDPEDHYHVSGVTAPNSYSISDPDEDGKYTITYAQNTNASSEINVTFAENTKHTIHFLNNGITAHTDIEAYEGEPIGDLLPALTTSDACDETIKTFAGWTTEDVGSTPVHTIDASKIVDYWTEPAGEMTLNALWATTSNTAKAQFIAANESAKTASEQNPVSLTSNNITFSYTSGNIYKSGTHNFGINANNYCTIEADGLVIEKAVVACTGSNYVIDGVSDGTLANNGLSVTDVRTNILALFASSSNALRITTLSVYTYDNYITKCCTPLGQIKGSFSLTHLKIFHHIIMSMFIISRFIVPDMSTFVFLKTLIKLHRIVLTSKMRPQQLGKAT